jgi:hypothetical protein
MYKQAGPAPGSEQPGTGPTPGTGTNPQAGADGVIDAEVVDDK